MAEKYGTVPKRFTSAWWTYFWDYYKWQTIGIIAVVVFVAVTVVQCATKEHFDMTVVYGGNLVFDTDASELMKNIMSERCDDVDGDGVKNVYFLSCVINDEAGNEDYAYAMQTKLDLSFQDEQTYLFLFDKSELDLMAQRYSFTDTVVPVSQWLPNATQANIVSTDGIGYAYCLKDSAILRENGIKCEDMYMVLIKCYRDDETAQKAFSSAEKLAGELAAG